MLLQNSVKANIVGITDSTISRIPRRALLIAMKLHSARDTDLRDIVMLGEEGDWAEVTGFANTGVRSKLIGQVDSAIRRIESREFSAGLRAEFGIRSDVTPLVRRTVKHLRILKDLIENSTRPDS